MNPELDFTVRDRLPHDDSCELLENPTYPTRDHCMCAVREAEWVAREGRTLSEKEWWAREVTGTPTEKPLKRGPEWVARVDAHQVRRARLHAYIEATRGQKRTSATLAYIATMQT